jgi:hypothetical protein
VNIHEFIRQAACTQSSAHFTAVPLSDVGKVTYWPDTEGFYEQILDALRSPDQSSHLHSTDISANLTVVQCENVLESGESWHTLRIDGFSTTGNMDWNEIDGAAVGTLGKLLRLSMR